MSQKNITIRDVARRAGVSVGTASRAMNSAPGVMAKTREAVREAAKELGYQPNAAARALRSRSSRLIGCLFSDLENPLFARLFNSLQDSWAEEGFVTLLSGTSGKVERERRTLETFAERGLDAIVVAPGHERDPELLRMLEAFEGPVFVLDRDLPIEADRLLFDHEAALRDAVDYLVGLGHRTILPVFSHGQARPGVLRHKAFDAALADLGASAPIKIEPETPNSPVFQEVTEVLSGGDRPTAMIVQGTQVLSSTLNALAHLRLSFPDDVSLIAIGDSALTVDHVPPITALRMDREALVDVVANRILDRIRNPAICDRIAPTLRYELVVRASCGARSSGG